MFSFTIESLFDEPADLELFPPNAYIYLLYDILVYLYCYDVYAKGFVTMIALMIF